MTATRSVNSWDIVIVREGDNVYLDKREGGPFGEPSYGFYKFVGFTLILTRNAVRLCYRQRERCRPPCRH
jgi:hypothetical protein